MKFARQAGGGGSFLFSNMLYTLVANRDEAGDSHDDGAEYRRVANGIENLPKKEEVKLQRLSLCNDRIHKCIFAVQDHLAGLILQQG